MPRRSLSSYVRRTFAVAGPTAWNSLSDDLRDPTLSTDSFRCLLELGCFQSTSIYSSLEVSHVPVWKSKDISTTTKFRLLIALVWSAAIYVSEGWTLRSKEEKYIEA